MRNPPHAILMLDDEIENLNFYALTLKSDGLDHVIPCSRATQAFDALASQQVSVLLLDLFMPEMPGREVLDRVTREYPDVRVVVITGDGAVETAVDCMRRGASDFVVKPMRRAGLITVVRRALEAHGPRPAEATHGAGASAPSLALKNPDAFASMITVSDCMRSLFAYVERVAVTSRPVFITGETGVGKELMARAVHRSAGNSGAFVAVNVAALDDTSFSDTLFGHKRGAFTGADRERPGLIEKAAGGTLFLDEIGDLSMAAQVKLLRLLQEREFYALGSDTPSFSDARVVVATSRPPDELLRSQAFRTDLYYRLLGHHIHIPALRERRDDLPALLDHFLNQAGRELKKPVPKLAADVRQLLLSYAFPGNLRELSTLVLDALSQHTGGLLTAAHFSHLVPGPLPPNLDRSALTGLASAAAVTSAAIPTLEEMEERLIEDAIRSTSGNLSQAAEILGISRQTLHRKLKHKLAETAPGDDCDSNCDTRYGTL